MYYAYFMEKNVMKQVNATDFQRNFAEYQDSALVEPLAITKHDRPRLVMMSYEDYHRLRRGIRKALHVTELSDEDMRAIMDAKVPSEYDHLNDELDD